MAFRSNSVVSIFCAAPILALCMTLSGCGGGDNKPGPTSGPTVPVTPPPPPVDPAPSTEPAPKMLPTDPAPKTPAADTAPKASPNDAVAIPPAADAPVQTEIKLDPVKYPQDTPANSLDSLLKAVEGNDLAYEVSWLCTPDFTARMLEKHKTIAATVESNQDPKKVAGRKVLLDVLKKMKATQKTSQGESHGVKWFCFALDNKLVQFELQKDGRWCWNTKVHSSNTK